MFGADRRQNARAVRRNCSITAGYKLTAEQVETALLEAASKVKKY